MLKKLLSNTKLLPKVLSLGVVITVCFMLVMGYVYTRLRSTMWDAKRKQTQNLVESAYEGVQRYADLAAGGAIAEEEAKAAALEAVKAMRYENDNYFWINDTEPRMVMHPTNPDMDGQDLSDYEDPNGKRLFQEFVRVCEASGSGFVDYMWPKPGFDKPVPKVSYVQMVPEWEWIIGTGVYVDDVQAEMAAIRRTVLGFGAGIAGLAVVLSFVLARSISNPLQLIVAGAERLALGDPELKGLDYDATLEVSRRGDELGEVGRSLGKIEEYFRGKEQAADGIARGELSVDVPVASEDDALGKAMVTMKESIIAMVGSVNGLIEAAVNGELDARADADEFQGEYQHILSGVNHTLDAVAEPLGIISLYLNRMAVGNLEKKITVLDEETNVFRGDWVDVMNDVNQCIDNVRALVNDANGLAGAAVQGKLDVRADASRHEGAYRELVQGVNDTLDAVVGPLNVTAEYVDRISKGDIPEKIVDEYQGDFNEIKNNLNGMIDSLNRVLDETDEINEAMVAGSLDVRGDADEFDGRFRQIVDGLNRTLDAVIAPLNVTAEYVDRISKGDIPERITDEYQGDFNEIKNNLNGLIESLNRVLDQTDEMNEAMAAGRLDIRGRAEDFQGRYGQIVAGLNHTLDAVVGPLNVAAEYVDRISRGDVPEKITDEYRGDFNEIKNNLNACIDGLGGLVEANQVLQRMAVNDYAEQVEGEYQGVFADVGEAVNTVQDRLLHMQETALNVSRGDLGDLEAYRAIGNGTGRRSENDQIVPAFIAMMEALDGLVSEMDVLTEAAVEGRLDARADAEPFEGKYAEVLEGTNAVLDSVVGLLGAMPSGLVVVDEDLRVRYMNEAAAEAVGRSSEGVVGARSYELFGMERKDSALERAIVHEKYITEDIQMGHNGRVKHFAHVAMPMMNLKGKTVGGIGVFDDQTAVREAAERTQRIAAFQQREVEKLQRSLNALAAGDLRQAYDVAEADEDTEETRAAFAAIADAFNESVAGLKAMASQMQEGAMNISSATSEILASSSQMASTTKEQASAVTEVTSTVEEIQSSAEQVAQRAQGVAEAAEQATRAARDGSLAADEAIAAMGDIRRRVDAIAENILSLSEQTQQIGEIIDTVTDIADQSNILALNAAIEAAQAGEAGKGFRVVADEVRSLAEQSRQAAAQVKVILGDIQEASNRAVMATEQGTKQVAAGSDQVERTAQTIRELSATVEQSSSASEQIVAGVQQQTVGLDQIAVGMMDINQAAQQAAAGAEQSEKAAQDLDTLGAELGSAVEQYRM
jgi:PAS domain S-box-containing protein